MTTPSPIPPNERYYHQRYRTFTHDELVAEIIRLHKGYGNEFFYIEKLVCEALGLIEDPDYGYPVEDTCSVVGQLVAAYKKLKTPEPAPGDWSDPPRDGWD